MPLTKGNTPVPAILKYYFLRIPQSVAKQYKKDVLIYLFLLNVMRASVSDFHVQTKLNL